MTTRMPALARLLAALAIILATALPAVADGAAPSPAIRSVIEGQIDAFRHGDGAAAYALAAPAIRQVFPSVDAFMGMVRRQYQPVYRPRSFAFGALLQSPNGPQQEVFVVGPDGTPWIALYTLQRQPDGTWKINGCVLVRDDYPAV